MNREEKEIKKTYLRSYMVYKRQIKPLEYRLEEMKLNQLPSGITYSDMPKGSGSNADLSNYMVRIDKAMSKLIIAKSECMKRHDEILDAISQMQTPMLREILTLRYINCYEWSQIGDVMGYERTRLWEIHEDALKEFILPEVADDTSLQFS